MENFPVEYIEKETGKKKVAWISRSVAVSGFIFCKSHGEWFVLANQRGEGAPDFKHCWNGICGYLDYDENAYEAQIREVYEETGLRLRCMDFRNYGVNSSPKENRQNVTIRHYAILKGNIEDYSDFSFEHMEKNEVENIRWIKVKDIKEYEWAFEHNKIIEYIFNKFINIPWYKKLVLNLYIKLFENDIPYYS